MEPAVDGTQPDQARTSITRRVTGPYVVDDKRQANDQTVTIGSSGFLAHRPPGRLLPEDAIIGLLADELNAEARDRAALHAAGHLLKAVQVGNLENVPLSEAARVHVTGAIDYHLRRGMKLSSFRLGLVQRTGDTAFLRARLFGQLGSTAAELYLILESDRWLVNDLQADWAALQRAQPIPEPVSLPRPRGWISF